MPQNLHGAAGVSNGTYAYAAGGVNAGGATLDTFYRYNPVNERWDTYPPPMPAALEMASAVYYPTTNSIYVFGGKNGERVQQRHAGSSTSRRTRGRPSRTCLLRAPPWRPATTAPTGGSTWSAGTTSSTGAADNDVGVRPRLEHVHHRRAPIPHAVAGAASGVIAGHLYVAGGHDASTVLNTTWDYSIGPDTWTARTTMPTPTDAPGSAVASGKLWVFGGETPSTPSATTVAYDPAANSWTSGSEPERRSLGPGGRCDREHARGRGRGHGLDVDVSDGGA